MTAIPPRDAHAYASLGEQAHVPILHDVLAPLIGDATGRTLLDFGCGDGRLTRRLLALGFCAALCIDESQELLDAAAHEIDATSRVTLRRGDESLLPTAERYDMAVCSLMLMMCDRRERLHRAVAGLIGSLAPRGRAFLVLTHPCFRRAVHATFHNELPPGFDYWQSGRPYEVVIDPAERQATATLCDYHWTLEDYLRAIAEGGGTVCDAREAPGQFDPAGRPVGPPAYLVLVVTPAPPLAP